MENITRVDKVFDSFSETINSNKHYLFMINIKDKKIRFTKSSVMFFGFESDVIDYPFTELMDLVLEEDREELMSLLDSLLNMEREAFSQIFNIKDNTGNYCTLYLGGRILDEGEDTNLYTGMIEVFGDVQRVDSLTGMWTSSVMIQHLNLKRESETPFNILQIGVKNFAEINDGYGYVVGDQILKDISIKIMKALPQYIIYKGSGVKFIIVSKTFEPGVLEEIYAKIKDYSMYEYEFEGQHITLEICGSVMDYDDFSVDIDSVNGALNEAYYQSKSEVRGELVKATKEEAIKISKRLNMLRIMRSEIYHKINHFYMVYQPFVVANDEKVVGAEALVRYYSDELGFVSPNEFIPMLESDAVFNELSIWIAERSMTEIKPVLRKYPDFVLNINLSYAQLQRDDFEDTLKRILYKTQFPTKNLCFELTERCRLLNKELLKDRIEFMHELGIQIALDDYGTGFSSLSLIQDLPIDIIKIDRGFIIDIEKSKTQQILVQSVCLMAHKLGLYVTIEGVETYDMKELLKQYDVNKFQGYYYSKPIDIDTFMEFIENNKDQIETFIHK